MLVPIGPRLDTFGKCQNPALRRSAREQALRRSRGEPNGGVVASARRCRPVEPTEARKDPGRGPRCGMGATASAVLPSELRCLPRQGRRRNMAFQQLPLHRAKPPSATYRMKSPRRGIMLGVWRRAQKRFIPLPYVRRVWGGSRSKQDLRRFPTGGGRALLRPRETT